METKQTLPQRKKDESMSRVLRLAKHLIEQKGYYNTTVRELCESCMISKTTFFNYFGTKENIVFMIADECADELADYIALDAQTQKPYLLRVRDAYCFILESLSKYNNLAGVMYQLINEKPERRETLHRFFALITPLVAKAQAAGELDARLSPEEVNSLLEGMQFNAFYNADADARVEWFCRAVDGLMKALCA